MTHSDCLRLSATNQAPKVARRRVVMACGGLGEEETATVELLTSELVTNAVVHPERHGVAMEWVTVCVERTAAGVRVEVHDEDGQPLPPRTVGPASLDTHGRGLYLVSLLASASGTYLPDKGGKAVWFEVQQAPHQGREESAARFANRLRQRGVISRWAGRVWSSAWGQRVRLARIIATDRHGPCSKFASHLTGSTTAPVCRSVLASRATDAGADSAPGADGTRSHPLN